MDDDDEPDEDVEGDLGRRLLPDADTDGGGRRADVEVPLGVVFEVDESC